MLIERVEVENYRALRSVDIGCDDLTVFLGRNGTGKSTVLYAIDTFYNVGAQYTPYDYFDKNTGAEIRIRITYGGLRPDEVEEFRSQLKDGNMIVTKVINSGGVRYFGASRQLPEFHEIRKLAAVPKRSEFNQLVESGVFNGLEKARSAGAVDAAMAKYESEHPESLETFESEQQFFGPKNIGGGKLDNFTKFVLIPAVRDASTEVDRKGVILQLIDVLVMRRVNKRSDVRALNEEFEKRVKEVYSHENLNELGSLAALLTRLLVQYSPGAELDLAFAEIVPPKIPLPTAIASLIEDNFKCPIKYSGHGLQRALIFALLQQLSITDLSAEEASESDQATGSSTIPGSQILRIPDLILAIEEPELYLHPSRSRYLSNVMTDLSRKPDDPSDPRTQVLYATHSPYFVKLDMFDQIRLARKVPAKGCDILQSQFSEYSRQSAALKLAEVTGSDPERFTAERFAVRATPVMTSMVNEGFFADVVVVVEGMSDAAALWAVQEILGKGWDAKGIAIVPAEGKNNIDRPVVVFRGLGIPTYLVFDGDARYDGTDKKDSTVKSNRVLLTLAGAPLEEFPVTQAHDGWAVFHDELEVELKKTADDLFDLLRDNIAEELGYDKSSAVLKNPQAVTRFMKGMYDQGKPVVILEEIIEYISQLCIQ